MKLMPIAILDADSQAKFLRFQKIALDRGVKMNVLNPHITMATYFLPDLDNYLAEVREKLVDMRSFNVFYPEVTYMKEWDTVTCNPVKDEELLQAYRKITSVMPEYLHENYRTEENFTPHTTIVGRTPYDLNQIYGDIQKEFTPFKALVTRIDFSVEIREGEFEIIHFIDLV